MTRRMVAEDAADRRRQAGLRGGPAPPPGPATGAWIRPAALRLMTRPPAWRVTSLDFLS